MYCDVDDFCQVFILQREKQQTTDGDIKRKCPCRMTISEIMIFLIVFHTSNHCDFKSYYKGYIAKFYRSEFPSLLSYTRFLQVMPRAIIQLYSYLSTLKGESTGIEFIDSTSMKVCHNLRIQRHKVFSDVVELVKGTMS